MAKTYIIAEVGPNHNGQLSIALELIDKLSEIGVDAVKFQISNPENAYSLDAFKPDYQKKNDSSTSPIEMSKKYQLPFEDHKILYQRCKEKGVDYLCSAFEMTSLQFLTENFDMPYYKIASGELLTIDMLEYMAERDRPILVSTGMAPFEDVEKALNVLTSKGNRKISIFHCVSSYPAAPESINLNVMLELKSRFGFDVGFSDHTEGNAAAIAAVALGAVVIEKHVTLDKNMPGPDHKASATVEQFAALVRDIRDVEKMMGQSQKIFTEKELEIKKAARKSIVSTRDLPVGHIITTEDITYKRPGFGFAPMDRNLVIGKTVIQHIEANRVIRKESIA